MKSHSGWMHWLEATIAPLKQLNPSTIDSNSSNILETEIGEERKPFWHNTILDLKKDRKSTLTCTLLMWSHYCHYNTENQKNCILVGEGYPHKSHLKRAAQDNKSCCQEQGLFLTTVLSHIADSISIVCLPTAIRPYWHTELFQWNSLHIIKLDWRNRMEDYQLPTKRLLGIAIAAIALLNLYFTITERNKGIFASSLKRRSVKVENKQYSKNCQ